MIAARFAPERDGFEDFLFLRAAGQQLFLLGYELHVYDIGTPSRPRHLGQHWPWGYPVALDVQGDLVVLGITRWGFDGPTEHGGLDIVDIANPAAPERLALFETIDEVSQPLLRGDQALLAAGAEGLRVVDLGDPTRPRAQAQDDPLYAFADAVVAEGPSIFGVDGMRLQGFDAADPTRSASISRDLILGRDRDEPIVAGDGHLYAGVDGAVAVYRVRDPDRIRFVAALRLGDRATGLAWRDGRLYVTTEDRFAIIDVARPELPVELSELPLEGGTVDLAIDGDHAHLVHEHIGPDGWHQAIAITTVAIADPLRPRVAGRMTIPLLLRARGMHTDIAVHRGQGLVGGALLLDLRDPSRPRAVARLASPGREVDSLVVGDRLYLAGSRAGDQGSCLRALDFSVPAAPRQVAAIEIPSLGAGDALATSAGRIVVASGMGGAWMYRDSGLADPSGGPVRCAPRPVWSPERSFLPLVLGLR